ncbi:MAG TPA: GNAT family N-acetyltransferase [Chitinophagaceae bacterium]|nr:GNAT family N-acetyltransferase [Chitinophagaceae bacterium]
MQVRGALLSDKPAIIDLLKESLGESTIPKSEKLWNWKHEQSPFGKSFVLVAEEDQKIVGVRAFMRWDWQFGDRVFKAVRAVDTATHPEYQGKGIFKKLTLQQIELCKLEGIDFVFNTPNEQSRPGYLKMGWIQLGKIPLKFKIVQPFFFSYAWYFSRTKQEGHNEDPSPSQKWGNDVFDILNKIVVQNSGISTILSPEYIFWRYAANPLFRYNYFTDNTSFFVVTRIKNHSFSRELRIVEFCLLNAEVDHARVSEEINKCIIKFCKLNNINFISMAGQKYLAFKNLFSWMGILPVKSLGPLMTIRNVGMNDDFAKVADMHNWNCSLGDIELF